MNAVILFIISIPLIEIYLMIKVGSAIGAFNTIFLIFFTAITGIFFARLEGLNAIKSGFNQLIKNFLVIGIINKNPIKSVKNPGIIRSKAAKARAAPEIIS